MSSGMIFAEVVVNIPIRRTFARRHEAPPSSASGGDGGGDLRQVASLGLDDAGRYQLFHYDVPPELESSLRPGYLVWVPFGARQVQGIVMRLSDQSPVVTRPILRLARPEPVLSPVQMELAVWLADYYVAPLSEAIKLFLPPRFLVKDENAVPVRVKRERQVELVVDPSSFAFHLAKLERKSHQATVLAALLTGPNRPLPRTELRKLTGVPSIQPALALVNEGLLTESDAGFGLAAPVTVAQRRLLELRGIAKYEDVLRTLAAAGEPLWQSDLYARVDTDLATLRTLEEAGLVALTEKARFRDPLAGRAYPVTKAPLLTSEQAAVWERIHGAAFAAAAPLRHLQFLLHGVTGSGKTEIYLRAIAEVLAQGKQAIVLVPEIALTPQTIVRFAGRFPDRATVIHSGLSPGERYDVWRAVRDGRFDVVVGPRSALFAPLPRLGLIVVDEEHEASYKQDAEEWGSYIPFYDARTVARQLAALTESILILGSATPSLEAYQAALHGDLTLLEMPQRVIGHGAAPDGGPDHLVTVYGELPPVEIVDMRQELRAGNRSILSRSLQAELHATLDGNEQAILFMNRRGTATFVMCRDCGDVQTCPRCATPLTYHERTQVLLCHRCNRTYPIPEVCPACQSRRIKYFGSGTQRIEDLVLQIAPHARVLRWDADTTGSKGSHEAILSRFAHHEADVLVGTQMIAKGLDLPLVTLVGVVAADVGLYLPDFRSGERTFQLLTQVAGRAGRSQRGGRVVIQTYTPEHYAVQAAAQHDYAAFFRKELAFRRAHGYPPLRRMARLVYWHKNNGKAQAAAAQMAVALQRRLDEMELGSGVGDVLGPAPAFFARYRDNFRWQLLLRAPDPAMVLRSLDIPFGWRVDIDPLNVL